MAKGRRTEPHARSPGTRAPEQSGLPSPDERKLNYGNGYLAARMDEKDEGTAAPAPSPQPTPSEGGSGLPPVLSRATEGVEGGEAVEEGGGDDLAPSLDTGPALGQASAPDDPPADPGDLADRLSEVSADEDAVYDLLWTGVQAGFVQPGEVDDVLGLLRSGGQGAQSGDGQEAPAAGPLPGFLRAAGIRAAAIGQNVVGDADALQDPAIVAHERAHVEQHRGGGPQIHYDAGTKKDSSEEKKARKAETDLTNSYRDVGSSWGNVIVIQHGDQITGTYYYRRKINGHMRGLTGRLWGMKKTREGWDGHYREWWPKGRGAYGVYHDDVTVTRHKNGRDLNLSWGEKSTRLVGSEIDKDWEKQRNSNIAWDLERVGRGIERYDRGHPLTRLGKALLKVDPGLVTEALMAGGSQKLATRAAQATWNQLCVLGAYRQEEATVRFWVQEAGYGADVAAKVMERARANPEAHTWLRTMLAGKWPWSYKRTLMRTISRGVQKGRDTASYFAGHKQAFTRNAKRLPPPNLEPGKIDNLDDVVRLAESWELGLRGYIEADKELCDSLVELASTTEQTNKKKIAELQSGMHYISSFFSNAQGNAIKSLESLTANRKRYAKDAKKRLEKIKAEDTAAHRLLAKVLAVKEQAEQGRLELGALKGVADHPEEKKVRAIIGKGRLTLADSVKKLSAMQGDVAGMVKEASFLRSFASSNRAESRHNRRAAQKASDSGWLGRVWKAASGAMKGFVERLKTVDWKEALEVGLEIAGTVLTGGAAMVVKLLVWVAKTGKRLLDLKDMIDPVKGIVEGIKNMGSSVLDGLFSPTGLMVTLAGVLFGKNALAGAKFDPATQQKAKGLEKKKPKKGQGKGLSRFLGIAGNVFGTLYGWIGKGVSWVAKGAKTLDMSQSPFFRKLAGIAGWLVNAGDRIQNVIMLVKGQLGMALAKVREFVGNAFAQARKFVKGAMDAAKSLLTVLASPAKFLAGLVKKLVEWVVGLLVTKPPSKVVALALKAAGVTAAMAGAKLLGAADALTEKTPMGPLSKKIETEVEGSSMLAGVSAAVAPAAGMLTNLGGAAMQGIDATEASANGVLGDDKKFAETVGIAKSSKGSGADKAKPAAQGDQGASSGGSSGGGGKKSSAGSSGGGGGDFVHHLKANLLAFSEESTNFDPLVADLGKDVPKTAQKDAAKGFGVEALVDGILSRPDWTDFLQPLGEVARAAVPAWQHTVDRFSRIGKAVPAEVQNLAKVPVKVSDMKRTVTGKQVSLTMPQEQWLQVQRLFAMAAVYRHLVRVEDFGIGEKNKRGKKQKVGGVKGLELWLAKPIGQQAIKRVWSKVRDKLTSDSLFGSRPKGSPVGFSVENGKANLTYASSGDELPTKPSELPTFETDPDGTQLKRYERTLTKKIWTGDWRRVVKFLVECGGWEAIGKQVGPRFAPQLLHFRTWICFELEKRYGAMRTGTASGFTSDEDLNFQWKEEDNKRNDNGPKVSAGPAERITQAEAWMQREFGDKWGLAFDIAFQLEARMAHLYTEISDPKKRRELARSVNFTSEAVNVERMAKGHHGDDHKPTKEEMAAVCERLGMPKAAAEQLHAEILGTALFKLSLSQLRARYDRLVGEYVRRYEAKGDPKKRDDKDAGGDPKFKNLDKFQLVKQITYTQLALARLNPEAYASPGGVKTTVTGAILKKKVEGGGKVTPKEKAQYKRTKEFSIDEAFSSMLEDNKNFEHQLSMGRFEDYPKLRMLVGDRDAWTPEEGGTQGRTKSKKGAQAPARGKVAPIQADAVAAGFRYNLYKYAWRLFDMVVQISSGAVSITDKSGQEHPLSISGVPRGVMNKWLIMTYSAYKVADNRTIYEHVVKKSLGDKKATDPKTPLGLDVVNNFKADVDFLNQTLDSVIRTLYQARAQKNPQAKWVGTPAEPRTFHTYFGGIKPPNLVEFGSKKEREAVWKMDDKQVADLQKKVTEHDSPQKKAE